MKFSIWLFVLTAGCLMAATAQTIPQGANAIELTTTLADSALFESVQAFLEEAGFDIDVANEEEGTVVTEYKTITEFKTIQNPVQIRILATLEDGVVLFKGQAKAPDVNSLSEAKPVVYRREDTDGEFLLINEIITRYAKTLDQATLDYNVP
ncbi:hypothetical protein WBJ53_03915 [Spirosoma sp. SC4-14]|uniref:hypothetical protein n=1 Tax=Spirosoma sp. SC4-14 TaxID=3128900 RepID=UPI0030CD0FEB